jgi:hypothetical protein
MGGPGGKSFRADLRHDSYEGSPALTLYVVDIPNFSTDISALIGEIVHDLRSSLDQLAWTLIPYSTKRTMKRGAIQQVYFPMAVSSRNFDRVITQRIPHANSEHQRFLKEFQPFRRTARGRAMRTLHVLSNTDKHRSLVPALFFPLRARVNLTFDEAIELERIIRIPRGVPMSIGTDLVTWRLSARPRNVQLSYTFANTPCFSPALIRPRPGNDAEDVSGTLTTIATYCDEIVAHFEAAG